MRERVRSSITRAWTRRVASTMRSRDVRPSDGDEHGAGGSGPDDDPAAWGRERDRPGDQARSEGTGLDLRSGRAAGAEDACLATGIGQAWPAPSMDGMGPSVNM